MEKNTPKNIDEYINRFPEEIQVILEQIRTAIREAAPDAQEKISYQMPTFAFKGNLVHFAAFKNHIGFYPAASGIARFKDELAIYDSSKGTIRFPLGQRVPYDLITKITAFRVAENLEKAEAKKKKGIDKREEI